jgi:deoxycytidylate deaminase
MDFFKFHDDNVIKSCNEKQATFLDRALQLARKSTCNSQRHGCVIVRGDDIIAEGYNHTDVHLYHKFSVHAEVDALSKVKRDRKYLSKCDLYVVRIGTDRMGNPLKYSKPCHDCSKAIEKSGIRNIYYSSNAEYYSSTSSSITSKATSVSS